MDDDQKWLEAAAGIEHDILYLRAALRATRNQAARSLEKDIEQLKLALAIYKKNAASGVAWPSPDDLFCIGDFSCGPQQVSTAMRRDFKTAKLDTSVPEDRGKKNQ